MKKSHNMPRLPTNVIADTTLELFEKLDHVEQTLEPIH
jgi:hypothetical protein